MMKKHYLYIVFILLAGSVFGQHDFVMYHMKSVPQSMYSNPGVMPQEKLHVGLPWSSIYINGGFTGPRWKDLVSFDGDSMQIGDDNNISNLDYENLFRKRNYLHFNLAADIFSFGIKIKERHFFTLNVTEKASFRMGIPRDMLAFIGKGNIDNPYLENGKAQFGIDIDARSYVEYGLGYTMNVNDALTIGGKFKYLNGQVNIHTKQSDISLETDPDVLYMTAKSNVDIRVAGLNYPDSLSPEASYYIGSGNTGFGFDVGASYKLFDELKLSASIVDLGWIKWDKYTTSYRSSDTSAQFTFEGFDISDIMSQNSDSASDGSNTFSDIADTLVKTFSIDTVEGEAYKTSLQTQFYVGAEYEIDEKTRATALMRGDFFKGTLHPSITLGIYREFTRWFSATACYTIANRNAGNIGLGFSLRGGPIQWYMVVDNVLAIAPQSTKYFQMRTGINILIRGKEKEKKQKIETSGEEIDD